MMTALRGILALAIIWTHLQGYGLNFTGQDLFFLISFPGRITVWIFFIISGYSIYLVFQTKYRFSPRDIRRFYFNRAIKILPLFYCTTLISWLCHLYLQPEALPPWQSILQSVFLLNLNFTNHGIFIFTPTWFIGVLIQFYLLAPVLVFCFGKIYQILRLYKTTLLLLFSSFICHILGYFIGSSWDLRNTLACLPLFLFGFFTYHLFDDFKTKSKLTKPYQKWLVYIGLFVGFEILFFLYNQGLFWTWIPIEFAVGVLGSLLIVTVLQEEFSKSLNKNRITTLGDRLFNSTGKFSYGLYLWHPILMLIFYGSDQKPFNSFMELIQEFILITIVSYVVSAISFFLIEKPYSQLYQTA